MVANRAHLAPESETRAAANRLLAMAPDFGVESFLKSQHYVRVEDTTHLGDALILAALPR